MRQLQTLHMKGKELDSPLKRLVWAGETTPVPSNAIRRRRRSSKALGRLQLWLICLGASLPVCHTQDGVVGKDLCACQPSTYEIQLNFSLTCESSTLTGAAPGIDDAACILDVTSPNVTTDLVPANASGIQVLEFGSNIEVIKRELFEQREPYLDGAIITYTSFVANATMDIPAQSIPQGLVVIVMAQNVAGDSLVLSAAIDFSNSCREVAVLVGFTLGWVSFIGGNPPNPLLCPPIPIEAPSEIPSDVPSDVPSDMPSVFLPELTIFELVEADPDLSTLESAIIAGGLRGALDSDSRTFTLFGPIDAAFAELDQDYLSMLFEPSWILHLQNLLGFHLVFGALPSMDLMNGLKLIMINDESIEVRISDGSIVLAGNLSNATIVDADLIATNGVLHQVDRVLLPSFFGLDLFDFINTTPGFATLVNLIQMAGLEATIRSSDLTLLAPTDDAFARLPTDVVAYLTDPLNQSILRGVLLYHTLVDVVPESLFTNGESLATSSGSFVNASIVEGEQPRYFINDAEIVAADGLAYNGIVHALDLVLFPPGFVVPSGPPASQVPSDMPSNMQSGEPSDMPSGMPSAVQNHPGPTTEPSARPSEMMKNLFDLISEDPDLSTLETSVVAAGFGSLLSSEGPYTLFGPTNKAFDSIDEGYLSMLLQPDFLPHLQNLLLYHVTIGEVLTADFVDGMVLSMSNGEPVTIKITDSAVSFSGHFFNSSMLLGETLASNGVLHKVDGVFFPRFAAQDAFDTLGNVQELSTMLSLITVADLEETIRTAYLTILPPTDAAFAALPEDMLSYLTDPENVASLQSLLLYHVIGSVIPFDTFSDGQVIGTMEGSNLTVSIGEDGTVFFDDAQVLVPDILARNGLLDPIDTVLIPPDFAGPSMPPASSPPSTSVPASESPTAFASISDVPSTLGSTMQPAPMTAVPVTHMPTTFGSPSCPPVSKHSTSKHSKKSSKRETVRSKGTSKTGIKAKNGEGATRKGETRPRLFEGLGGANGKAHSVKREDEYRHWSADDVMNRNDRASCGNGKSKLGHRR